MSDPFARQPIIGVDCNAPHVSEVFRVVRVARPDSDGYPSGSDFHDFGRQHCEPYFDDLTVVRGGSGSYKYTTGYSTEAEWQAGDRFIMCLLLTASRQPLPPGQAVVG